MVESVSTAALLLCIKLIPVIGVGDGNDLSNAQTSAGELCNAFNPQTGSPTARH